MFYADDTQLYVALNPKNENQNGERIATFERCIGMIREWMEVNMLKLNDSKTEVILLGSHYFMKKFPSISINVGECCIESVSNVRNLGAWFDECLQLDVFVKKNVSQLLANFVNFIVLGSILLLKLRKQLFRPL